VLNGWHPWYLGNQVSQAREVLDPNEELPIEALCHKLWHVWKDGEVAAGVEQIVRMPICLYDFSNFLFFIT